MLELYSSTFFNCIPEENVTLLARQHPLLIQLQIAFCRWYQPEDLGTEENDS